METDPANIEECIAILRSIAKSKGRDFALYTIPNGTDATTQAKIIPEKFLVAADICEAFDSVGRHTCTNAVGQCQCLI